MWNPVVTCKVSEPQLPSFWPQKKKKKEERGENNAIYNVHYVGLAAGPNLSYIQIYYEAASEAASSQVWIKIIKDDIIRPFVKNMEIISTAIFLAKTQHILRKSLKEGNVKQENICALHNNMNME